MDKVEYEGLSFSPVAGILFVESQHPGCIDRTNAGRVSVPLPGFYLLKEDSFRTNLVFSQCFSPVAGIVFVESQKYASTYRKYKRVSVPLPGFYLLKD